METNLDVIRAMFRSLSAGVRNARGKRIYKFSELRDLLAKENVDVSDFNLRRKADQQALLSVAEKCIYDLEQENRIAVNNESDYPDIPLTYAWQFEGVDDSKDCFLYPTTPLSCDVLSGQYCELVVSNKGCSQAVTGQKQTVDEPSLFPTNEAVNDSSNKNGAGDVSVKFGQPLNQLNYSFSQVDTPTHPELVPGGMLRALCTSIKGCPNLRSQFNGFYEETRNTQQINLVGFKPAPFLEGDIVNQGEKFSIQSNRSKPTVLNEGFNEIKPIQVKGVLPNLLIDNWLLAENYLKYSIEKDDGDYTDLPMVINLVVASIASRKQSKISRLEAIGLLKQLCPFFNDIGQLENLFEALRQDDELYRVLCKDMLSEARKQALTNPFELPDFIKECTEVKSMIEARASKDPSIKLVNGWLHPLSEVKEDIPGTESQPYCNAWQFASLIVGAATRRCPNTDAHGAITILVDFDVIESEKSVEIEQAKSDDAVYQERQKFVGRRQKACAVERRGDRREQGFKAPTKMKFGGLQLVAGWKPLPYCSLLPSALCPLPSSLAVGQFDERSF